MDRDRAHKVFAEARAGVEEYLAAGMCGGMDAEAEIVAAAATHLMTLLECGPYSDEQLAEIKILIRMGVSMRFLGGKS